LSNRKPQDASRSTREKSAKRQPPLSLEEPAEATPAPVEHDGPALGLVEVASVARGMVVADAMAKRAFVKLVQAEPVTPGKFVIVVAGGEEEVAQTMTVALELSGGTLVDRLYLPQADPQLVPALAGDVLLRRIESIGIVETFSVAASVLAADRCVKAAEVSLVQLRLARGLGGKAFFILSGALHQVEAALDAGRSIIHDGMLLATEIIARPHEDLIRVLLRGSS
jgi:microcompartment protein CcmL/EutN